TVAAMYPRWPGDAERCATSTGVSVFFRDLMQSRNSRWWPGDTGSCTARSPFFSRIPTSSFQWGSDVSNLPRSTHTPPCSPAHLVPPLMSSWPPAMTNSMSLGYLHVMRYFVAVFQTACGPRNSAVDDTSSGPIWSSGPTPYLVLDRPQWPM